MGADPVSSGLPSIVHPTASSSLELLRVIQATYKNMGRSLVQPLQAPALAPLHEGDRRGGCSQTCQTAAEDKHVLDEAHGIGVGKLTHEKG
jgi:hypothetical protein